MAAAFNLLGALFKLIEVQPVSQPMLDTKESSLVEEIGIVTVLGHILVAVLIALEDFSFKYEIIL